MRWIEYDYTCNANKGVVLHKKVEYNDANIAIAQAEALNGYTITEDGVNVETKPIAIEFGGTDARDAAGARENLGVPGIDDVFTKTQTLTNETKAKFGLGANAVPDDVLALVGAVSQWYVWDKCTPNFTYTQTAVKGGQNDSLLFTANGTSAKFRISNTLEEAFLGVYTEQSITPANRTSLNGKYVRTDAAVYSNQPSAYEYVFYIAPSATWSIYTNPNGYCFSSGYVYSNPVEAHIHHEYLNSPNPNAYPTLSDGYFYKALGQLGGFAGGAKIETGSYTGTGTYGAADKANSLTFGFEPKFVYVNSKKSNNAYFLLWLYGAEQVPNTIDNGSNYNVVTQSGNTISWYCEYNKGAANQCNVSGSTYQYIAIG